MPSKRMNVLIVVPSTVSTGEAITALHMARDIVRHEGDVRFLASSLTTGFLADPFADRVTVLGPDIGANQALWERTIRQFRPDFIVFADYPLLFFPSGTVRLADESWVRSLDTLDAALLTLDHLGYAQRQMTIAFGPPHLSLASAMTPEPPARMRIALPCPVQEPGPVDGRTGTPFRYWDMTLTTSDREVRRVRTRFVNDERDLLILHSTPGWARQAAELWGLPYYALLARLLASYLGDLPRPVTVVSVNDGRLLAPSSDANVRVVNVPALPAAEYEALVLASDLFLTENSVSVGLGKAICARRPAAVLRNSHRLVDLMAMADEPRRRIVLEMESARLGAIFPFEVFPIWTRRELDHLGIHRDNGFVKGFVWLEAFGGEETRQQLHDLLLNRYVREALCARQDAYGRAVAALPGPVQMLRQVADG